MPKSSTKLTLTPSKEQAMSENEKQGEDFYQMVSEAAYYRSEKRGFEPGYDMEDWVAAEAEILALQKEKLVA